MAKNLLPVPKFQFLDNSGKTVPGGKVFTYAAGTTNKLATFTDSTGGTPNLNPIILDANGRCDIWITPNTSYKIVFSPASDTDPPTNAFWTEDQITADSTLRADLAASSGSSLVGFTAAGTGAGPRTLQAKDRDWVSVLDFFANGASGALVDPTGVLDSTLGINAAIAAVGSGGTVLLPAGTYKTTAFLNAENLRGITLLGSSGQYGFNGTRIVGSHTGKAIISLVGSIGARIDNIILEGDTAARPKTGLLLGRSSAASAGSHTFVNLQVQGFYSVAAVYNIASENNDWINITVSANAAPFAGLYMSQADGQIATIGGLTSSSMEANNFYGGTIGNIDTTAGSAALYIDCGASTGHHHFYGTFFHKEGGDSFIFIRLGAVDGLDTTFPIGFHDCFGEATSGPTSGLHFSSAGTRILAGFTAKNLRFATPATNNILCDGGGSVYLIGPEISTPYRATGNKPSTFNRIDGGRLELLSESAITITQLVGSTLRHNISAPTITTNTNNEIRDMGGTIFTIPAITKALVEKGTLPTYGPSVAIDASLGNDFDINAGNNTAFTVTNPTNAIAGQLITIRIRNNSGVPLGAVTWDTLYKLSAWTSPATGNSRSINFRYNGANWVQVSQTGVDVPN